MTAAAERERERRPSIASIVLNDVSYDSRVRATAAALGRGGADVTVLGVTSERRGWEEDLGDATIRVLPFPPPLRFRIPTLQAAAGALDRARSPLAARRERRVGGPRARMRSAKAALGAASGREQRRAARHALDEARAELKRARGDATVAEQQFLPRLERAVTGLRKRARRIEVRGAVPRHGRVRRRMVRELARLCPAAIHANDADGLEIAVAALPRIRRRGGAPKLVYDAHEWTLGRSVYVNPRPGAPPETEMEAAAIAAADAVITVSEPLAERLREHYRLARSPAVVNSAIPPPAAAGAAGPPLRSLAGAPADAPLLVYAGRIAERRGIAETIGALALLPGAFLAAVGPSSRGTDALFERLASEAGVSDRTANLPPVPPDRVVAALGDSDVGLIPLHPNEQHAVAMPNKLFQYAQAGVPIVCSDCAKAAASFVRELGVGEVFRAGDPGSLAEAVTRALARRDEIRRRLAHPEVRERISGQAQERILLGVYSELGVLS